MDVPPAAFILKCSHAFLNQSDMSVLLKHIMHYCVQLQNRVVYHIAISRRIYCVTTQQHDLLCNPSLTPCYASGRRSGPFMWVRGHARCIEGLAVHYSATSIWI